MSSILIILVILTTMLFMVAGGYWLSWRHIKSHSWWLSVAFLLLLGCHFALLLVQFTIGEKLINVIRGLSAVALPVIGYLAFAVSSREKNVLKYGDCIHVLPIALFTYMFTLTLQFANHWLILTDVFYGVLLLRLKWCHLPVSPIWIMTCRLMGGLFLLFASLDTWILWHFMMQGPVVQFKALLIVLLMATCFGLGVVLFSIFNNQCLNDVFTKLGVELSNRLQRHRLDESLLVEIAGAVQHYVVNSRCYIDEKCNLKSVACAVQYPIRHVSAAVNHHFGYGFSTFINDHKVEEAKRLLRSCEVQNKSITEIMYESGYQTKSSFNREFLRRVHMSPSSYRRQFYSS